MITFQCHLADTDAELDGIKDEKFVEVIFLLQNTEVSFSSRYVVLMTSITRYILDIDNCLLETL